MNKTRRRKAKQQRLARLVEESERFDDERNHNALRHGGPWGYIPEEGVPPFLCKWLPDPDGSAPVDTI